MRTDNLVSMLATGAGAVDAKAVPRRTLLAVGSGTLIATVLLVAMLDLNPALARHALLPMFWVREAFCAALATGGLIAALRLARPGAPVAGLRPWLLAPLLALWVLAAAVLLAADPGERAALVLGISWSECSYSIALLSIPVFIAVVSAMRSLAPTRLRLAGAAAGLASGATAAFVYTLHCPELEAPFIAVWYVLGMLIPTMLGACVGPRLLRW